MTVTRWTRLAAVWLLGMGLFIASVAVYGIVSSRGACDVPPYLYGYRLACDLAWIFAAVAAVIAGLHVVTAVSVWRGRVRGAVAGGRALGPRAAGVHRLLGGRTVVGGAARRRRVPRYVAGAGQRDGVLPANYLGAVFVVRGLLTQRPSLRR